MKNSLLFLLSIIVFGSCGYEPMASVDYTFTNKSSTHISLILNYSYIIKKDTIRIETESFHMFKHSYEDQDSPPPPFYSNGIDTIFLIVQDTIHTTYYKGSSGKSPFSLDSYTGGQISKKRGMHYFSYVYDINID
ncbi:MULTISPECIES: hypothetical protein [unclassified Lentimicrobium]|uniref:hypothetical protein n=1 Tax=unclassified Lentimicrobium TaxID=2677434 RepID=UPI001556C4D4|nr:MULTISPECIES: hypothetical protein [unclassified Lentimicrobium]NPD44416.1 hypothetical protein [Lentimicrobium sp. S6]NPD84318.1 hypothetical protein [Lentimicrobium sp. L6]